MYYALFHALAAAGAAPFAAGARALENQVVRAYAHGPMRKVCERYLRSSTRPFQPPLDALNTPAPDAMVIDIAEAFVVLQEARHMADYDLSAGIEVDEANELFLSLTTALDHLRLVRHQPASVVFLTALLLDDRWTRRG